MSATGPQSLQQQQGGGHAGGGVHNMMIGVISSSLFGNNIILNSFSSTSSIQLLSSNTTTGQGNFTTTMNDTAVCHPLLLAQGNKSQVGLCDDTPSSVAISAIVLFVHTTLLIVSIGGLIYKLRRIQLLKKDGKKQHVVNYLQVARDPALMVLAAFCGWFYSFVLMTRVMIGRKIYPCFIFSLVYYLAVPAFANAVVLRCIRLLVLTKLNELKIRIGRRQHELHPTTSSDNIKPLIEQNASATPGTTVGNEKEKELNEVSSMSSLGTLSSLGDKTRSSLSALTVGRASSILSQFTIEPKENENQQATGDQDEEMIFRKETVLESFEKGKLLSIFRFLVSSKFVLLYYGIVVGIHLLVYIIVGIVDYFNYQNDVLLDSNQKRNSFTIDSYLFSPSGCGTGSYNQYIFISYFAFYGLIGIVFSIIAFLAKRDVWNVKIEIMIINLAWVLVIISYGVPSLFTVITTFVDYYFPWTITILIGNMWDTLISLTYPVFILQRFKKSEDKSDHHQNDTTGSGVNNPTNQPSNSGESNIRKILTNEKWNVLFLKFSEKCFACEDIMMWNGVEKYRAITSEKQRRELFYNICNTYVRVGGPLELNLSRKDFGIPEIMQIYKSMKESTINYASKNGSVSPSPKINGSSSPKKVTSTSNTTPTNTSTSPTVNLLFSITPEIFDKIQKACEHNMLDNYTRFQQTNEKVLEKELGILPKMKV